MVPFDNSARSIPKLGADARRVSEKGFSAVINQVTRTALHAGLQYHLKQVRRAHPGVDIVAIEPKRTDARMFFDNPMRFSSRMRVARHGYESVIVELDENHDRNKELLAKHGLTVRRNRAFEVGTNDARWDRFESTLELLDREVTRRRPSAGRVSIPAPRAS